MKTRLVDAEKAQALQQSAIRYKHQNALTSRFAAQIIERVLKELDLWEKGET